VAANNNLEFRGNFCPVREKSIDKQMLPTGRRLSPSEPTDVRLRSH
jgi:hypothetical protein